MLNSPNFLHCLLKMTPQNTFKESRQLKYLIVQYSKRKLWITHAPLIRQRFKTYSFEYGVLLYRIPLRNPSIGRYFIHKLLKSIFVFISKYVCIFVYLYICCKYIIFCIDCNQTYICSIVTLLKDRDIYR